MRLSAAANAMDELRTAKASRRFLFREYLGPFPLSGWLRLVEDVLQSCPGESSAKHEHLQDAPLSAPDLGRFWIRSAVAWKPPSRGETPSIVIQDSWRASALRRNSKEKARSGARLPGSFMRLCQRRSCGWSRTGRQTCGPRVRHQETAEAFLAP